MPNGENTHHPGALKVESHLRFLGQRVFLCFFSVTEAGTSSRQKFLGVPRCIK